MSVTVSSGPAWEHHIRAHTALSIVAIKTGNDDSLRVFQTARLTASLLSQDVSVSQDVKSTIGDIHMGSVEKANTDSKKVTDTVEALKNTTPDPNGWKAKILGANQEAKEKFAAQIDAAGEKAINYIGSLPDNQQNGAADIYHTGMSMVTDVIKTIGNFLGKLFDSIKDFLAGIWNKVTEVWNSVSDTCISAAKGLASMFGFSLRLASFVPGAAVAAGDVSGYTGTVAWGISVPLSTARNQLGDIQTHLNAQNLGVASEQLAIEDVPGKGQCIVARVRFGPQFPSRQGLVAGGNPAVLADIWTATIGTLIKVAGAVSGMPFLVNTNLPHTSLANQRDGNGVNGSPNVTNIDGKSDVGGQTANGANGQDEFSQSIAARKLAVRRDLPNTFFEQST